MLTKEQEMKMMEVVAMLDEIQNVLAATIALNDPAVMKVPVSLLIKETVTGLEMLDGLTPAEQEEFVVNMENEYKRQAKEKEVKTLVSTDKNGKVVLH